MSDRTGRNPRHFDLAGRAHGARGRAGARVLLVEQSAHWGGRIADAPEIDGSLFIDEGTEGLSVGDRVITRGNERLQPGQAVVGQPLEYPAP